MPLIGCLVSKSFNSSKLEIRAHPKNLNRPDAQTGALMQAHKASTQIETHARKSQRFQWLNDGNAHSADGFASQFKRLMSVLNLRMNMNKDSPTWHQRWGNVAQMVSAIAALCAVVGVIVQLYLIRSNAKEASARQVYMSYSEATLKYPELSQPTLEKIKSDPIEYIRYKNFVGQMLFAYDEILTVYDTAEWRKSFNDEFQYHLRFICEDTSQAFDELYFPKMRELLHEARRRCPDQRKKWLSSTGGRSRPLAHAWPAAEKQGRQLSARQREPRLR